MEKYPMIVTIDTNIFDSNKYDLSENSTLQLLKKYVDEDKIKVVLSDIVVRESKNHCLKLARDLSNLSRKTRKDALKMSSQFFIENIGLNRLLETDKTNNDDYINNSVKLFERFIEDINAEIIGAEFIDIGKVLDDYFEINPPFEQNEKKRKEFPDAFIISQIQNRFGNETDVAIISRDNGLQKAFQNKKQYIIFDSLKKLFDKINQDQELQYYEDTIKKIQEMKTDIKQYIRNYIMKNENIELKGDTYDEIYLKSISNLIVEKDTIDCLSSKESIVTFNCKAEISVDCYYQDYENALWDSEIKEYYFVNTIGVREFHDASFSCRIKFNILTNSIQEIFSFFVILDGITRKRLVEITEDYTKDVEEEFRELDRKTYGFIPLDSYETFLEEDLLNSQLVVDITKQFEKINKLYDTFETFLEHFELLLEELKKTENRKKVQLIIEKLKEILLFPDSIDVEDLNDEDIEKIKNWIENQNEKINEVASEGKLPDSLHYGERIVIKGLNDSEVVFHMDEITINPTEGSEEIVHIHLANEKGNVAEGCVKLRVGYLHFDEDGGVLDSEQDEIIYEYSEIMTEIKKYVSEQEALIKKIKECI